MQPDALTVPGAFASPALRSGASAGEQRCGRRMQETLRSYGTVAGLVDREVVAWDRLPEEQQRVMDKVIKELNQLSTDGEGGDVATEAQFVLGVLYQEGVRSFYALRASSFRAMEQINERPFPDAWPDDDQMSACSCA